MDKEKFDIFLKRTTLRQIEVMLSLIEHKSMSSVAEDLGVSVASVSRMSARFERNVSMDLFEPGGRRQVLSKEGEAFIMHLRPLLNEINNLRDELAEK
jgi:LysR family transcriptional regulator of gallate degradation